MNRSGAAVRQLHVSDEAWIALASLQHENPARDYFTKAEILSRVRQLHLTPTVRPGVSTHISQHNVANKKPNPGDYRMFISLGRDRYRLYRTGDAVHSARSGKTHPDRTAVPREYA